MRRDGAGAPAAAFPFDQQPGPPMMAHQQDPTGPYLSVPPPIRDPADPAWRPPLDGSLRFPPRGEADHPNLKELLYANLREGAVVLDVGCGPGPFEYASYRARFVAFDQFEPETRDGFKHGDEFRPGRLERFPFEASPCDAVILGFILEHVIDPGQYLREAERVLKPGGWCYIAVPNHRSLEDRVFRLATSIAGSTRGPHIQRFTFLNFQAIVRQHTTFSLQAWHFLPASYLYLNHRWLRPLRWPFIAALRQLRAFHLYDGFGMANFQLLFRKRLPEGETPPSP